MISDLPSNVAWDDRPKLPPFRIHLIQNQFINRPIAQIFRNLRPRIMSPKFLLVNVLLKNATAAPHSPPLDRPSQNLQAQKPASPTSLK